MPHPPVLEVDDLALCYRTPAGDVAAVDGVSLTLARGEAFGLVGESGCGKTSVALALLRLLPGNARITRGSIRLDGVDLLSLNPKQMRRHRWRDVAMIFQGAMNAWNPVYTVGRQVREAMEVHGLAGGSQRATNGRIDELFELVGLDPSVRRRYPHELSGGMRQRAVIAMALSCGPKVLIADEPTTALDVIVQDRILRRLRHIQEQLGTSIIYISHDLAVMAQVTDRIGIMYAGKLVEVGRTEDVYSRPLHPYGALLLRATPSIRGPRRTVRALDGEPPDLLAPPPGCRFHPRCPLATATCTTDEPPLEGVGGRRHATACWHWPEVGRLQRGEAAV